MISLRLLLRAGEQRRYRRYRQTLAQVERCAAGLPDRSDSELRDLADDLRRRVRDGHPLDALLAETFALVRETAHRTLGMRHYDVQLVGAIALHDGTIAEMRTGEGKTLTATPAVALNALAGDGVHLVTVNDYLAARDAELTRPLYEALGFTVGVIQADSSAEQRRTAYGCDILFATNSELGFDYLRDHLVIDAAAKVQGRHHFAIVDEVDNILIDEARTPLIVAGEPYPADQTPEVFAGIAARMTLGERPAHLDRDKRAAKAFLADYDYEIDEAKHTVAITELGVARAERLLGIDHLYLPENGHLVNALMQALKAKSLYHHDVDYAVIDGAVHVIDEHTGRILAGRRWQDGLHEAVEAKEGLTVRPENPTVASVTYQNYFRLYDKLAGMTGTAMTDALELEKIYGLQVVEIPTHRPVVRVDHPDRVYRHKHAKWAAVVELVCERHASGQPVLVGTASIEDSELVGGMLADRGVPAKILNAKPQYAAQEAQVVAQAGRMGAVTIATSMAGRGVDIKLGGDPEGLAAAQVADIDDLRPVDDGYARALERRLDGTAGTPPGGWAARRATEAERVRELGGLLVIGTERHESRRIDNQLRGRAGRQGDPGESVFIVSAEDDVLRLFAKPRMFAAIERLGAVDAHGREMPLEGRVIAKQVERAQQAVEEQHFMARKTTVDYDDVLDDQRHVIYKLRDRALAGDGLTALAAERVAEAAERLWAAAGENGTEAAVAHAQLTDVAAPVSDGVAAGRHAREVYEGLQSRFGLDDAQWVGMQRQVLLNVVDAAWREHLGDMDYLRSGIHLRSFIQVKPIDAFRHAAFELFEQLVDGIWERYASLMFHARAVPADEQIQSA